MMMAEPSLDTLFSVSVMFRAYLKFRIASNSLSQGPNDEVRGLLTGEILLTGNEVAVPHHESAPQTCR